MLAIGLDGSNACLEVLYAIGFLGGFVAALIAAGMSIRR